MSVLQDAIHSVENTLQTALADAQAWAEGRHGSENILGEVQRIRNDGHNSVYTAYMRALLEHEEERAKFQQKAQTTTPPTADEAAQMLYVRDSLLADARTSDRAAMEAKWRAALEAGDRVTLRVFRDHLPDLMKFEGAGSRQPDRTMIELRYRELMDATNALLASSEQREAQKWLADAEGNERRLKETYESALTTLAGAKFNGRTLVIPQAAQRQEQRPLDDAAREAARRSNRRAFRS